MSEYIINGTLLTNIADAVRSIDGSTSTLTPAQMITRLNAVKSSIDSALSALTAKEVEVPSGSTVHGLAELIASIEAGVGGSVKDVFYETLTSSNPSTSMIFISSFMPNCVVIVGDVTGGSTTIVGLAVHVEDENGNVYQEKWRFQSTKYLVGTTATDGSLFTISKHGDNCIISINSSESSFGTQFGTKTYKIFAAKIF